MNHRFTALISTLSNTFCDIALDFAVNKYYIYYILFITTILSTAFQLLYGIFIGIEITIASIPIIIIYGLCILLGYFSYAKSLTKLPIGLAGMIESGSLFIFLIIDMTLGYLKINLYFIFFFVLFLIGVFIITYDNIKVRTQLTNKKFQFNGFLFIIISIISYSFEPYLIKLANNSGANEIAINLGYYLLAILCFGYLYNKNKGLDKAKRKKFSPIMIIILISLLESIYYLFGTISYINDTPVIVAIIQQLRVFLLILIPVIMKTDRLTIRETIGIILGLIAVLGIYMF